MPFAKGQSGNPGGRGTEKVWREAILKAVRERDTPEGPQRLSQVAEAIVRAAIAGDVQAAREIGDRLDGKAAQAIIGGDPDDPPIEQSITVRMIRAALDRADGNPS